MSRYSRKDYEKAARGVAKAPLIDRQRHYTCWKQMFEVNPRFDAERFREACRLPTEGISSEGVPVLLRAKRRK